MKTWKSWTRSICLAIAFIITHSVLAAEQFVSFDNGDLLLNKSISILQRILTNSFFFFDLLSSFLLPLQPEMQLEASINI